ncbi:SOS-response transcriptional repressor LexA (RecA-mediated autopeptidase) [Marinospirillum celere]|uniref:SOS-response transcriptional repressor LexA (RecA-mediated autopeptidase) n=2 Tax=Marinospirillum celere TaxID=1122252 RepID=A0A1I1E5Y9_9GAMM|nr:SOS-response transcriptional repressor LexA (RecA-mediated autopeptidase) [Marinospirillum celere]
MADELHNLGVDIDTGNLSRIETNKQGASNEVLDGILRAFGISIDDLLSQAANLPSEANVTPGPDIKGYCPVISWVQAGEWSEIVDIYSPGVAEEWLPCPGPHSPNTFVLRVAGESMYDPSGQRSFKEGDLIFVDPERHANNGSLVVVRLEDHTEATFKQLVIEGGQKYLKALNPSWPNRIIPINGNATICGVVSYKVEVV